MTPPLETPFADSLPLSDAQIERIAERAASKAVDKVILKLTSQFYEDVGRNIIRKGLIAVGLLASYVAIWAQAKGYLKLFP